MAVRGLTTKADRKASSHGRLPALPRWEARDKEAEDRAENVDEDKDERQSCHNVYEEREYAPSESHS